jgi:hypothetical protein
MKLIDFCQISSLYLYVNIIYPLDIDSAFTALQYSNIEPLFQHLYKPMSTNYTVQDLSGIGFSPIYIINDQMPESLNTTVYLLGVTAIGWIVVGVFSLMDTLLEHHSSTKIFVKSALKKVRYAVPNNLLNLSIITFVFAAVTNFKHVDLSTQIGMASLAAAAVSSIYVVAMIGICIKNILSRNKSFDNLTSEQNRNVNKMARVYEAVAMARKVLLAVSIALLFE